MPNCVFFGNIYGINCVVYKYTAIHVYENKDAKGDYDMKPYKELTKNELLTVKAALEEEYKTLESKGLKLNMARGKPGFTQLDLCEPMLDIINSDAGRLMPHARQRLELCEGARHLSLVFFH